MRQEEGQEQEQGDSNRDIDRWIGTEGQRQGSTDRDRNMDRDTKTGTGTGAEQEQRQRVSDGQGQGEKDRDRGTSTDMGTVLEEGKGQKNRNSTIGTGGIVRDRR